MLLIHRPVIIETNLWCCTERESIFGAGTGDEDLGPGNDWHSTESI
jgi:hypothetical protein